MSRSNKELNKEEVRNVVRSALRPQVRVFFFLLQSSCYLSTFKLCHKYFFLAGFLALDEASFFMPFKYCLSKD